MTKCIKKFLAVALAVVLVCLMTNTANLYAQTADVGVDNYTQAMDDQGNPKQGEFEFVPNASAEYGTITVPAEVPENEKDGPKRYMFTVMDQEINVNMLVLETGSSCTVMSIEGKGVIKAEKLVASNGARLTLSCNNNIPIVNGTVLEVYDSYWNDEQDRMEYVNISDDTTWTWKSFVYDSEAGKWVVEKEPYNPYDYFISIEGITENTTVDFSYSLDNSMWTSLVKTNAEQNDSGVFDFNREDTAINFHFDFAPAVQQILDAGGTYDGNVSIRLVVNGNEKIISFANLGEEITEDGNILDTTKHSSTLSSDRTDFTYSQNEADEKPTCIQFVLSYPNEGDPKAKELIENELYAYGDLNGDGVVNLNDIESGLKTELCLRYFWENGGILDGNFEISGPYDLDDRLTFYAEEDYTALDNDGREISLKKYPYSIKLGSDHQGQPVDVQGYVYALRETTEILVFDGTNYFIRDLQKDGVDFDDINHSDAAICVSTDYEADKLKINGNGGGSYERMNPDTSNIYTVSLGNEKFVDMYNKYYKKDDSDKLADFYGGEIPVCGKLRIVNNAAGNKYVALKKLFGEGEELNVPGISAQSIDSICDTGADKYTEVFVGDSILHIYPVSEGATGLTNTGISDVSLADDSQSDAVKITKKSDSDYQIEFLSNYYDEAKVVITFEDGTKKEFEIRRIALVISYMYLDYQNDNFNILHGSQESETNVRYNYEAGEQIAIYATYYHPGNDKTVSGFENTSLYITYEDGTTKIIPRYKYTAAKNGSVATSDYIIGLVPSKKLNPDNTWGEPVDPSLPSCNAIVVNGGFADNTTFGGTQMGKGKGIYWDGVIEWNY